MMIWIVAGWLTALTMLALLVPALRTGSRREFLGGAQQIYRDQLAEVDRDAARNVLSADEATAARTEVKRRMLSAARRADVPAALPSGHRAPLVAAAVLAPLLGLALYGVTGSPLVASQPIATRRAEIAAAANFEALVGDLRSRLESDPNGPVEGWILLGQTYMRMGRHEEAAWAFGRPIERGDAAVEPALYSLFAEAQINVDSGIVTPKAEAALDMALGADPADVAAIFFKSFALEQSGELRRAYDLLRARIEAETAYQTWMELLVPRANDLAAALGAATITPTVAAPGAGATSG